MYCPHCGKEVLANEKFCANCGAQISLTEAPTTLKTNKKPLYRRWWFWVILGFLTLVILFALTPEDYWEDTDGSPSNTTEIGGIPSDSSSKYLAVSVDKLVNDLEANALNAKEKYEGEYVEITGRVDVIDASGQYISLYPTDDEWCLTGVQCFIENKKQKEYVKNISTGDIVTIRGKITSVGEILGYSLDIDEFVE